MIAVVAQAALVSIQIEAKATRPAISAPNDRGARRFVLTAQFADLNTVAIIAANISSEAVIGRSHTTSPSFPQMTRPRGPCLRACRGDRLPVGQLAPPIGEYLLGPCETRPNALSKVYAVYGLVADGLRHAKGRAIDSLWPVTTLAVIPGISSGDKGIGILLIGVPIVKTAWHRPRRAWSARAARETD